jgi:FixJ family two-component response regulator
MDQALRPANPNGAIIFVIEGDPEVRDTARNWIETAGYQTEVFASAGEFMLRRLHYGLGCVLADVSLGDQSSFELQARLKASLSPLPFVFISAQAVAPLIVEAMKNGAVDFLLKPLDKTLLIRALHEAMECSQKSWSTIRDTEEIQRRAAFLTPREMEVFQAVVCGSLNKQIASQLGTVEKTIKVHRGRVMKKMGARSLVDLVRMSEKLGASPALVSSISAGWAPDGVRATPAASCVR